MFIHIYIYVLAPAFVFAHISGREGEIDRERERDCIHCVYAYGRSLHFADLSCNNSNFGLFGSFQKSGALI